MLIYSMNEQTIKRIKDRIAELDTSARAVSLEVTGNTNAHLLQKLYKGIARDITSDKLLKLSRVLKTTPEWILQGRGEKNAVSTALDQLQREITQDAPEDVRQEIVNNVVNFGRYEVQKHKHRRAAEKERAKFKGEKE